MITFATSVMTSHLSGVRELKRLQHYRFRFFDRWGGLRASPFLSLDFCLYGAYEVERLQAMVYRLAPFTARMTRNAGKLSLRYADGKLRPLSDSKRFVFRVFCAFIHRPKIFAHLGCYRDLYNPSLVVYMSIESAAIDNYLVAVRLDRDTPPQSPAA